MAQATVYSTQYCPYCRKAERLLQQKGADFEVIDVTHDDAKRIWLVEETGKRTVPQIWVGSTYVGGCDELYALDRRGELDPLLADAE